MLHQRKKDYLQRIIEEFFAKLQQLVREESNDNIRAREILNEAFTFYADNFNIYKTDDMQDVIEKLGDVDYIGQYAKLLYTEYTLLDIKYIDNLHNALFLVEHLQRSDKNYSWERSVLREDILRLIEQNQKNGR